MSVCLSEEPLADWLLTQLIKWNSNCQISLLLQWHRQSGSKCSHCYLTVSPINLCMLLHHCSKILHSRSLSCWGGGGGWEDSLSRQLWHNTARVRGAVCSWIPAREEQNHRGREEEEEEEEKLWMKVWSSASGVSDSRTSCLSPRLMATLLYLFIWRFEGDSTYFPWARVAACVIIIIIIIITRRTRRRRRRPFKETSWIICDSEKFHFFPLPVV